jgi:hypothetical protein
VYDYQGDHENRPKLYETDDIVIDERNDPRNEHDLLQENMTLKESMIEQIMTME